MSAQPPDSLPLPDPLDRLLTLRRVAQVTPYSERSLRRWCARGRVPGAWQPGGREGAWYVPARALLTLGATPATVANLADVAVSGAAGAALRGSKHDDEA